jgi:prevent-host-death family protein
LAPSGARPLAPRLALCSLLCYLVQKRTKQNEETHMAERPPVMETINASQVRKEWSQLINQVFRGETRVLVEKSGIPVAAIISAADLERLRQLEEEHARRFAVLERTWAAFQDVPIEEIEEQVAQAVQQVRQTRHIAEQDNPGEVS